MEIIIVDCWRVIFFCDLCSGWIGFFNMLMWKINYFYEGGILNISILNF